MMYPKSTFDNGDEMINFNIKSTRIRYLSPTMQCVTFVELVSSTMDILPSVVDVVVAAIVVVVAECLISSIRSTPPYNAAIPECVRDI